MTDTEAGTPLTAPRTEAGRAHVEKWWPNGLYDRERLEVEPEVRAIEDEAALAARPATDPAGLDAPCERSLAGLLCDLHGGAYWPSLTDRCNGWIALAAARLAVADGPGPEERLRERIEALPRYAMAQFATDEPYPDPDGWIVSRDDVLAALSRPLPENREEPSR